MESLLAALADTSVASALRGGRWSYAALNAAHVFGIALLVGAVVPLNLRLLGAWSGIAHATLARVLVPMAAAGLGLAGCTGALLFATRAPEYAQLGVLRIKLALVALGAASALWAHWRYGWQLQSAERPARLRIALLSLTCWPATLVCGRLIAFVE